MLRRSSFFFRVCCVWPRFQRQQYGHYVTSSFVGALRWCADYVIPSPLPWFRGVQVLHTERYDLSQPPPSSRLPPKTLKTNDKTKRRCPGGLAHVVRGVFYSDVANRRQPPQLLRGVCHGGGGGAAKPTWKGFVNSRRRRCRATVLAVEGGGRRCVHTILEHSSKTQLIAPSTARAQMKCIRTSEDRRLLFIATCQGWRDRKVMRQTEHHLFTIYSSTTKSVGEGARGGGGMHANNVNARLTAIIATATLLPSRFSVTFA